MKKVQKVQDTVDKKVSSKKMDVKKISADEVQDLFTEAFADQVGFHNDISEFDVKCEKGIASKDIKVEVTIQGMAGCPNAEDFKKGKIKNIDKVVIERADKGSLEFKLLRNQTVYLNSTEYIVVYQSV